MPGAVDGNHNGHNHQTNNGDNPSFTLPGVDKEYRAGDKISEEDAEKIVEASNGQLRIENGHIVGKNPDGTGDVDIDLSKPLGEGQIHDLHHTVPGSGGAGNDGGGHH